MRYLTSQNVGDTLEAILGDRVKMDPYGFKLTNAQREHARLQRGSGIATRGEIWALVRLPEGSPIVLNIATRASLRRAVLEFMAGPKPPFLSDYTVPRVKRVLHPDTRAPRFVWYRHLKKRPAPQVALVPFGAAQR